MRSSVNLTMSVNEIGIPQDYNSQLHYVTSKDLRSDAEILLSLTHHVPIVSEKNIWAFWHSGVLDMPAWCKRNVINWIRLHGSSWTVRVLDTVPGSSNHALRWVTPEDLPNAFVQCTMTGPYVGPHSADFLCGAALYAYGGVWMDVGCVLFRNIENVCWDQLADESNPYTIGIPWMVEQYPANHFVAARKGDVFIKKWHDLFMHLWKHRTDFEGVIDSPLVAFMEHFQFSKLEERGFNWDFCVDEKTMLGYIGQCVAWIRLTWLQEPDGGFDGVAYYAKKVLLWDVLSEHWPAERNVGFKGKDVLKLFTTNREDDGSAEFAKVERTVWKMLAQSTMQKITHGKELTHSLLCGALLDLPENEGKDMTLGTFGELLRFGSVHLEQTREMRFVDPVIVKPEFIIRKGLLEA